VDHVNETVLAEQIRIIAETYLDSRQVYDIPAVDILLIDITIVQRTFMHDVDMFNSIYVSCVLRDKGGKIFGKENEYISGKRTIISSVEQNTVITRVVNRFLDNQQDRYKAIQAYLKNQ
jgi:hypothetical protein